MVTLNVLLADVDWMYQYTKDVTAKKRRDGEAKDYQVWFINPHPGQVTRISFMTIISRKLVIL